MLIWVNLIISDSPLVVSFVVAAKVQGVSLCSSSLPSLTLRCFGGGGNKVPKKEGDETRESGKEAKEQREAKCKENWT